MSYEPTNWKAGDTVTSAKLNKLEQGVANSGGSDIVGMTIEEENNTITYTVNKTWQEIWDNNCTLICYESDELKVFYQICAIDASDNSIHIVNLSEEQKDWLTATNANGYPMLAKSTVPVT